MHVSLLTQLLHKISRTIASWLDQQLNIHITQLPQCYSVIFLITAVPCCSLLLLELCTVKRIMQALTGSPEIQRLNES